MKGERRDRLILKDAAPLRFALAAGLLLQHKPLSGTPMLNGRTAPYGFAVSACCMSIQNESSKCVHGSDRHRDEWAAPVEFLKAQAGTIDVVLNRLPDPV